jgi:hypothetical protein
MRDEGLGFYNCSAFDMTIENFNEIFEKSCRNWWEAKWKDSFEVRVKEFIRFME